MSNPQSNIPGRTPLTDEQKALIQQLDARHREQMHLLAFLRKDATVDQRAIAIATTHAETAHMWAVRAVAKPVF
jgi:hypothetical protein